MSPASTISACPRGPRCTKMHRGPFLFAGLQPLPSRFVSVCPSHLLSSIESGISSRKSLRLCHLFLRARSARRAGLRGWICSADPGTDDSVLWNDSRTDCFQGTYKGDRMTAMGENVKQNQMVLDILERCVIQLGILVAQGQKGGPLTTQEYVQAQLDMLQAVGKMHAIQRDHRQFPAWEGKVRMGRLCRLQRAVSGRSKRRLLRKIPGILPVSR